MPTKYTARNPQESKKKLSILAKNFDQTKMENFFEFLNFWR